MGYGPWGIEFWELIALIAVCGIFFRPRSSRRFEKAFDNFHRQHDQEKADYEDALDAAEDKIDRLEDRIRVLERIVTEEHKTSSLSEEIDNLRKSG